MNLLLRELVRHYTLSQEIRDMIKLAHVIVVQHDTAGYGGGARKIGDSLIGFVKTTPDDRLPFAPPFPLCWIEAVNTHGDTMPIRLIECVDDGGGKHDHRAHLSGPVGALVKETAPGVFDIHAVELHADADEALADLARSGDAVQINARSIQLVSYRNITTLDFMSDKRPAAFLLLAEWLRMINEGTMAVENTDAVLMMPRGDGRKHKRKPHPIRRIVRILPKTMRKQDVRPLTAGGVIDWSHRWEVRGHWRHVKGVGKDRAGDYIVVGFTWVKDFVKGPQDKPLVIKTREVEQRATP